MRLLTIILALSLVASLVNISLIPKDQWRETVAFVIERSRTEDVALLAPGYMVIPFDYYSRGRIGRHPIRPPSAESQLESLLNEHERVWLVSHQVDIADPEKRAEGWLAKHANRVESASFYHIQVELYER